MVANKTWTIKRPTKTDLIELFVSKSYFHSHYRRYFSKVAGYPEMVEWLEGKPDCSSDVDVWGAAKANYTFMDLSVWLANGGMLEIDDDHVEMDKSSKGRRKGKDKESGREREREKRQGKEKKKDHKKKKSSKQAK